MRLHKFYVLLVVSSLSAYTALAHEGMSPKGQQKLNEIVNIIKKNHLKTISEEKLIEAAANGILTSLDSYSYFFNAKAFEELNAYTSGEFCGIGVEVKVDRGRATVVSSIPNGPAALAGIKPMDRIIAIDNHSITSMPQQAILNALVGKPETKIIITIMRRGKQITFPLLRKKVTLASVEYELLTRGIVYLKIRAFYENTASLIGQIAPKLQLLQAQNKIKGFILDLRNNPGGKLEQAVSVASIFIKNDLIVKVVSSDSKESIDYESLENPPFRLKQEIPLVVLINGGTASAAEVVAAALQDHKRAFIVGAKSFGKGSVQVFFPLKDGDAINITTALYYTPSGRLIENAGLIPDIPVNKDKKVTLKEISDFSTTDYTIKLASSMMQEKT